MRHQKRQPAGFEWPARAGVIAALAIGVALVTSRPSDALIDQACAATFEPPTIPTGSEAATAFYSLSESIGEPLHMTTEEGSGLRVVRVDMAMATLTLSTVDARPGTWEITFHGEAEQTCAGSIDVIQSERRSGRSLGRPRG